MAGETKAPTTICNVLSYNNPFSSTIYGMNTSTDLPLPYWCLEEMEEEYVRDYYVHLERDVTGQSPDILRHTNQLHNVHRQFLMRGNQIPTTRGQNDLGALSNMVHKSFQDWQRENAVDIAMNLYDNKIAEYNDIDTPHIKKKRDYDERRFRQELYIRLQEIPMDQDINWNEENAWEKAKQRRNKRIDAVKHDIRAFENEVERMEGIQYGLEIEEMENEMWENPRTCYDDY